MPLKISGMTSKASPVSGDIVPILDSQASNANKRTTIGGIIALMAAQAGQGYYFVPVGLTVDGTGDNTAAIMAAINDAADTPTPNMKFQSSGGGYMAGTQANGGGVVILPPGTLVVTTIVMKHRVVLQGSGWGTVLFQKAATSGPVLTNLHDGTGHAKYWQVRDLTIHGNADNQTNANHGIHAKGDTTFNYQSTLDEDWDVHALIHNVQIIRCKGSGIYQEGSGENHYSTVFVRSCDGIGIHLVGYDSWIDNCSVAHSGLQGIKIDGDSSRVTNTKSWYNGRITPASGHGFHITADRGEMTGCGAQDNKASGFFFDFANQWTATGLGADGNSTSSPGTYPGIDINGGGVLQIGGTCGNRYNASGPVGGSAQPQTTALRHKGGATAFPNDIVLTAGMTIWGTSLRWSADSTPTGSHIRVNNVVMT